MKKSFLRPNSKGIIKLMPVQIPRKTRLKPSKMPVGARKPIGVGKVRKRRKKGELTKLKLELWRLTRIRAAALYEHSCFTCGVELRWGSSVMQLGHFIPRSNCSQELHFDMKNLRWQCRICNQFKDGRWPDFEARLIREHGLEYVNELKTRNQATKGTTYPLSWYQNHIKEYEALLNNPTQP